MVWVDVFPYSRGFLFSFPAVSFRGKTTFHHLHPSAAPLLQGSHCTVLCIDRGQVQLHLASHVARLGWEEANQAGWGWEAWRWSEVKSSFWLGDLGMFFFNWKTGKVFVFFELLFMLFSRISQKQNPQIIKKQKERRRNLLVYYILCTSSHCSALLNPTSAPVCRPTESVWPKMWVPWHPWTGRSCNSLPEKLHVDDITGHTTQFLCIGWISWILIFCTSYNLPLLNFTCQKGLKVRIKRQKQLANTPRKHL